MSDPHGQNPPEVAELYRRYGALVRARIRRFFPAEEADDVLQEVFVRVMEKLPTYRGESAISTWLHQLTTRYCLNRLRDSSRRRELLTREGGAWWSGQVSPADQEKKLLLHEVWRTIDEDIALVGIYYYLDGMTREDIAATLECSVRTVAYRLEALRTSAPRPGKQP